METPPGRAGLHIPPVEVISTTLLVDGLAAPLALVTFTIGLDSFRITDTRSQHEDTDFVSVSLAVGNKPPVSQTRSLGNVNNGTHPINLSFPTVKIAPNETAVLTYSMVNAGHQSPDAVTKALQAGTNSLAQKAAQIAATAAGSAIGEALGASIGTAAVPLIGTALGALAGWVVGGAFGLILADCDGPVAAGVHVLTYAQIKASIEGGHGLTQTDEHPGVDSNHGCGGNSHYFVTWSVR